MKKKIKYKKHKKKGSVVTVEKGRLISHCPEKYRKLLKLINESEGGKQL